MSGYTPDPSWPSIVELAIELWGQPTRRAPNELRFGAKESKSVRTDKNVWFDNETNEGGGYRDLHMLARRVPPPANDARPRTNGHGPRLPHEQDIARHANRIIYIRDGSVERDEIVSKPSRGSFGFAE